MEDISAMEDLPKDYFDKLYQRAEKWLSESGESQNSTLPLSVVTLLQELSIHRVELEMQNEELRNLQTYVETNRDKFKELFDNAPVGYVETDHHGRVIEANHTFCMLINYDRATILQLPFVFFIASGDKQIYYNHLNHVIGTGSKDTCELTLFRRKGINRKVLLQSACINDSGSKHCFTAIIEVPEVNSRRSPAEGTNVLIKEVERQQAEDQDNETEKEKEQTRLELKKTLAELARTNKELEEFTSIISHDLQEPVRMVEKLSLLLLDRYKGKLDPQGEELTHIIVEGAVRMRELVKELLNLSKITTKGKPFEWVNSKEVLKFTLTDLQFFIKENNAIVTYGPMPEIFADRIQLEHIFQNLIANAIKYHRPGVIPEVQIGGGITENEWVFSVKDNGIGIDPEFHERIFRIFQRLHLPSEYEGSGVGLTLCQKIIDRHKGRIWVESQEGKGATFYFTIPKPK